VTAPVALPIRVAGILRTAPARPDLPKDFNSWLK
jgi:hypothetical protein